MDSDSARAAGAEAPPRQRWRIAYSRRASDEPERDFTSRWIDRLVAAGLPLATRATGRPRPALSLAAPLPLGVDGDRELADLLLGDQLPAWRVREAVAQTMPEGCRLVGLDDVWVGAPALAGSVIGADYRATLDGGDDPGPAAVRHAAGTLTDAAELPRERVRSGRKGGPAVTYDLRPLLAGIEVGDDRPTTLRLRVRFDPALGSGRPEEVLAALGDALGRPIAASRIVRERLLVKGEDDGAA
ncbi:MAG TPA: DUF2344 domain-containing protein [Candidatus Limnocylindrales bacterium]